MGFFEGFEKRAEEKSDIVRPATVGTAVGGGVLAKELGERAYIKFRDRNAPSMTRKHFLKNLKPGDVVITHSPGRIGVDLKQLKMRDIKNIMAGITGSAYGHSQVVSKTKGGIAKGVSAVSGAKARSEPLSGFISHKTIAKAYRPTSKAQASEAARRARHAVGTPYSGAKETAKYVASALTGKDLPGTTCKLGPKGQAVCHQITGYAHEKTLGKKNITAHDIEKSRKFKLVGTTGKRSIPLASRLAANVIHPVVKGGIYGLGAAGATYAAGSLYNKIKESRQNA